MWVISAVLISLFELKIILSCYDTFKAHDGGVVAIELSRVIGGAPQLITIGADKNLAIWDTISFKVLYSLSILLDLLFE